jgi:Rps23 Pro-64 3,4-dihydroxylase Tpa1-like proline 4-hydroxylase
MANDASGWSRSELAEHVAGRLLAERERLKREWDASTPIQHFVLDDLMPEEAARALAAAFPAPASLMRRRTWREHKRVGVDVESYAPIVHDFLYAFQESSVRSAIEAITGVRGLEADPTLYASGLSVMTKGDFLHPHLDNSHDGDNRLYRVLNILYYAAPDLQEDCGGELELWDPKVETAERVPARFNRLAVMATHRTSWHSVREIQRDATRLCVSNYYFSAEPPGGVDYAHVTSFAGRPEHPWLRAFMKVDSFALNLVGRLFPSLTTHNPHRIRDEG